jgi:dipeptidase E
VKFLLTSNGVTNDSIRQALVDLLGKPIEESSALFVPTAVYSFEGGPAMAYGAITGTAEPPLCQLGWKSLGVLELSALPSVRRENWVDKLRATDALLVWGGDVMFLTYWMRESGLAELLPSLADTIYVGVSAGSIVVTPFNCDAAFNQERVPPGHERGREGDRALGLVDFTLHPHLDRAGEMFEDASMDNIAAEAVGLPFPMYAIDDNTAIKVVDGNVEVVSEGNWRVFNPGGAAG